MKMRSACALILAVLLAWPAAAGAQAEDNEVNVEGVSGLLAVPTAAVTNEGEAVVSAARYLNDTLFETQDYLGRSYNATVGYLPGLEISARFLDVPNRPDVKGATNYADRSVALKYQLYRLRGWSFAVGATDIGGRSQRNEAYYGVVDYQGIPQLTLSAGAGTDKFEGVFGGARWTPVPWASLVGEYDTRQVNYGVELRPHKGVTLKGGIINDHGTLGASYSFPLDPRGQETRCHPVELTRCATDYADSCDQATAVRDALVAQSFENVLVGASADTLFVEYENRRFREQLDGLAVAAAVAAQYAGPPIERLVVTPKLDDVPQLSLQARIDALTEFLADPGIVPAGISVSPYLTGGWPSDTTFVSEANRKPGHGDVQLRLLHSFEITRPNKPTFASKNGLGLEETVYAGRGLSVTARQDWPLHNDITDKTDPFNRDILAHYINALSPDAFLLLSGGYYGGERYGGTAQAAQYFNDGRYRLGGRYAYVRDESSGEDDPEDAEALGELAFYEPGLDLELSVLGGQFLEGDRGLHAESTRYFGPTTLTFFAYDTTESAPEGGVRIFVPLPWYSEARHDAWRATGRPYFAFQYITDSEPTGRILEPDFNLSTVRGQLRPEYVRAHLGDFGRALILYLGCS
jgi:hypothetical protein